MKTTNLNTIIKTQTAEAEAKAAKTAKVSREEALAAVKPETILDLYDRVASGNVRIVTDENDNIIDYNISTATNTNIVKMVMVDSLWAELQKKLQLKNLNKLNSKKLMKVNLS